jgi:hypothetical protein
MITQPQHTQVAFSAAGLVHRNDAIWQLIPRRKG